MKILDAKTEDVNHLDELLTKLIHVEKQFDHNLNGKCVIEDNYISRVGLDGHK